MAPTIILPIKKAITLPKNPNIKRIDPIDSIKITPSAKIHGIPC